MRQVLCSAATFQQFQRFKCFVPVQAIASMVGLALALLAAFCTGSGYTAVRTDAALAKCAVRREFLEYLSCTRSKPRCAPETG